jgi:hypothetical protein
MASDLRTKPHAACCAYAARTDGAAHRPSCWLTARSDPWLIPELLPTGIGLLYGAPGAGKSSVAGEIACALATGMPILGRYPHPSGAPYHVVYVVLEGGEAMRERVQAWCEAHGGAALLRAWREHTVLVSDLRLLRVTGSRTVLDEDHLGRVETFLARYRARVERRGEGIALVVIDTVAQATVGHEVTARQAALFVEAAGRLRAATGARTVLGIHHPPHAAPGRPRGSTALVGALDFAIAVHASQGGLGSPGGTIELLYGPAERDGIAYAPKLRAVAPPEPVVLRAHPVAHAGRTTPILTVLGGPHRTETVAALGRVPVRLREQAAVLAYLDGLDGGGKLLDQARVDEIASVYGLDRERLLGLLLRGDDGLRIPCPPPWTPLPVLQAYQVLRRWCTTPLAERVRLFPHEYGDAPDGADPLGERLVAAWNATVQSWSRAVRAHQALRRALGPAADPRQFTCTP